MARKWLPIEAFVDTGGSTWLKMNNGDVRLGDFYDCQWMRADGEDIEDAFTKFHDDGNHIEIRDIFAFCPAEGDEVRIMEMLDDVTPEHFDPTLSTSHLMEGS